MLTYLYENQNINDEHKELKKHIENSPSLHKYFESNFNNLKPKNYCGFLSINNESYFIIPKIVDEKTQNLNTFIYMLMYAYDINLKNEDLMNADNKEHQIFELFVRLFADALLDEFKKYIAESHLGKDYQIGHSYFMKIENDDNA